MENPIYKKIDNDMDVPKLWVWGLGLMLRSLDRCQLLGCRGWGFMV